MKKIKWLLCCLLVLSGCTTRQLPLCARLAQSKPCAVKEYPDIGLTLYQACVKHHITISELSSNIAEFRGHCKDMRWLQANYHILMCDFDQNSGTLSSDDYTACVSNAVKWMDLIKGKKPQDLMKDGIYCPRCVPNKNCY